MIEVSNLSHHYQTPHRGEIVALRDVNLSIQKGEFVAILGPNGCGKTTLAKHLNGLLIPTQGTVKINGLSTSEPSSLWKIRQQVGMVFQNPENQLVATLVEEDVAFGPENLGLSPSTIRRRVDDALKVVGMSEFAKWEPHLLSAGQQQRIALAGVLAMEPDVLVLDEPTSMLDFVSRKEVLETVRAVNKEQNATVVYITHLVGEAIQADRVIVMQNGRVFLQGTPRGLFTSPMRLRDMGINPLPINELAVGLARAGLKITPEILTIEEMVEALCSLD